MPLSRNQPSPDRQTVLSFVSPSVADLLFYETVDAKTVGAGSGKTITAISSAEQAVSVASGYQEEGFNVTVTCNGHGYAVGDVVTIVNAPTGSNGLNANGTYGIRSKTTDNFVYFVRGTLTGSDDTSTFTLTGLNPHVYKSHPQYGAAHPDTEKFPNHTLCYVKQADGEGLYFEYYYAAEREFQDDYNFEFSQADLGGNKYDTVVRTYVNLRSDFTDTDLQYEAGDAMPDIPAAQFVDTYILLTRQQKRIGDQELDGIFVVEQRVYFNRVDIVNHNMDPATGGILSTVEKVVYREEGFDPPNGSPDSIEDITEQADYAKWGLDAAGRNWEAQQLSNDWWKVTIQDVIPQSSAANTTYGPDGKTIRTYDTWQNFTWPSVLDSLVFTTATRKDGSSQTAVTVRMKEGKDGFGGPTKMTVLQVWSKAVLTPPTPTIFKTASAKYSGVQYNVSVSNVLTPAITLIDFIGSEHPTYKLGEYAHPKPWCRASSPTDWPSSAFVGSATQKPFRGGYLLEVVTVHPPS